MSSRVEFALLCFQGKTATCHSPNRRHDELGRILSLLAQNGLNAALVVDPDPVPATLLKAELSGIPINGPAIALACPERNHGTPVLSAHRTGEAHEQATKSVALEIRIDNNLVNLQNLSLTRLIPIRVANDKPGGTAMDNGLKETLRTEAMNVLEIVGGLVGAGFAVLLHTLVGLHIEPCQSGDLALGHRVKEHFGVRFRRLVGTGR